MSRLSRLKIEDAQPERPAKIAVLGAGFTGLTAAYELAKKGHQVFVFEKEDQPGGLAQGFKLPGWTWYLEETYHHLFASDRHTFKLIKELGLSDKLFFKKPVTGVYYEEPKTRFSTPRSSGEKTSNAVASNSKIKNETPSEWCRQFLPRRRHLRGEICRHLGGERGGVPWRHAVNIFPLDTPFNFLLFPHLSPFDKIRSGATLAYLKATPFWQHLEKIPAKEWILKYMGRKTWKILWEPLFINKFGLEDSQKVPASWFWGRIKKRSQRLGYIKGGFQTLAEKLVQEIQKSGGRIYFNHQVKKISLTKPPAPQKLTLQLQNLVDDRPIKISFKKVIVTLPTPVFLKITSTLPENYIKRLSSVKHLCALTLILVLKKPFLKDTYWLNVCDLSFPFLLLVDHTNFIDPGYYDGNHLLYIGNYLPDGHPYFSKSKEELLKIFLPYLEKINPSFNVTRYMLQVTRFNSPFAQPVFSLNYSSFKPDFASPLPGLFLANQDQIYPWDRGVNYAIELGERVADLV